MSGLLMLKETRFLNVNSTHGGHIHVTATQNRQASAEFGKQAKKTHQTCKLQNQC